MTFSLLDDQRARDYYLCQYDFDYVDQLFPDMTDEGVFTPAFHTFVRFLVQSAVPDRILQELFPLQ
jgi:hypothetical protein